MAEGVAAHLSQKSGFLAVGIQSCQKIAGSAAGVGSHGGIAAGIRGFCGKVNEQFAQRNYIDHILSSCQSLAAGYSVHSRR